MAAKKKLHVKMKSTQSHFFYVSRRNPKNTTEKLVLKKYDPVIRKHVDFKEASLK
ncbi:50S ribosomal protein L33 [Candidatus Gromoviella agglomerans]|uniref:50S ribosomal protein L33 n=1 Tax=Candidatus Gromoviella agglomerans TaxID=2806609 RepID=UPI001E2E5E34|nr:50S ribosomal protein L33 [Candidatus Gromoviella agglomerans]UFX98445.1 50S ribosomal protein L33 [Candidatus Gromoviella agglomerans]